MIARIPIFPLSLSTALPVTHTLVGCSPKIAHITHITVTQRALLKPDVLPDSEKVMPSMWKVKVGSAGRTQSTCVHTNRHTHTHTESKCSTRSAQNIYHVLALQLFTALCIICIGVCLYKQGYQTREENQLFVPSL